MNEQIEVVKWVHYDEADAMVDRGAMGGWFNNGHRWKDCAKEYPPETMVYYEAIRRSVIANNIRINGGGSTKFSTTEFRFLVMTLVQCFHIAVGVI